MSWHFSRELVAESLRESSLGGDVSVLSKSKNTHDLCSSHDKTTVHSTHSRYGMTSLRLTDDLGEAILTWFRAGFPARTSAQPEKAKESPASVADSGWKWPESSVKYDPDMRLWKTRQYSLLGDSEWFSETWPRWGLMRLGECWELPMSERPIYVRGSGLWQTLVANDAIKRKKGAFNSRGEPKLSAQVRMQPTLTCHDRKGKSGAIRGKNAHVGPTLTERIGGTLSPMWSEWFMGWPIGFTSIGPLDKMALEVWIYASTQERTRCQGMRVLWWSHDPAEMGEREVGQHISSSKVLLKEMLRKYDYCGEPYAERRATQGSEDPQSSAVRAVRGGDGTLSEAPQGPRHGEQRSEQYRGSVLDLSQQRALTEAVKVETVPVLRRDISAKEGGHAAMWKEIMRLGMGAPFGRTTLEEGHNADRIKALGNGQVPQCAAEAWRILSE